MALACSSDRRMVPSFSILWRGSAIRATSGATSLAGQSRAINCSRADGGIGGGADQRDHLVDIGDGDGQADQHMAAVARLGEVEARAAGDHFLAEGDEGRRSCP